MKRFAIIMLALIAINSSVAFNSVEAKTTRTTKTVQTIKRKKIMITINLYSQLSIEGQSLKQKTNVLLLRENTL